MTRKECLDEAAKCVLKDRQNEYGKPEDSFETIATMWSAYLGKIIQGWDVAAMMALLKIARIKANAAHADNWCDLAGYAACGAECHQKFEAETKKTVEEAFEAFPLLTPRAEGVEELVVSPFDKERMRQSMPGIVPQDGPSDFDAPQTKEALFQHIVDCNPATFRPHKPTGEELAEMAQEDARD